MLHFKYFSEIFPLCEFEIPGGECFWLTGDLLWEKAKQSCEGEGGQLAVLMDIAVTTDLIERSVIVVTECV